jgi:hypothetical protein
LWVIELNALCRSAEAETQAIDPAAVNSRRGQAVPPNDRETERPVERYGSESALSRRAYLPAERSESAPSVRAGTARDRTCNRGAVRK